MPDIVSVARDAAASLNTYLAKQRWFRAADRAADGLSLSALAQVAPGLCWARIGVGRGDTCALYQLPVCLCEAGEVPERAIVVAPVDRRGHCLADALYHEPSRQVVAGMLQDGGSWASPEGLWRADRLDETQRRRGAGRLISGEQSNSSVIYGKSSIFKLYRRLEAGINPDLELVSFLTARRGFAHVPRLRGTLRFESLDGRRFDAAMLQDFVADAADGWTDALQKLTAYLRDGGEALPWLDQARTLGEVTRGLHDALCDPNHADFAPQTATATDLRGWTTSVAHEAAQAWRLLEEHLTGLPLETQRLAETVLARRDSVAPLLGGLQETLGRGAGARMRHHGDYHLGQVLYTRTGSYMVLDFEGEPLRPLEARRARHSPLRDVAGMLRSLAYAAATAAQSVPAQEAAARNWQTAASHAFLSAYSGAVAAPYHPPDADATSELIKLFVLEKTFYELRYELNHRLDWTHIPLRGLDALLKTRH